MKTARSIAAPVIAGALALLTGCACHSNQCAAPSHAAQHDEQALAADRAHLAQLVGAWEYEGWSIPEGQSRRTSKGQAAGVIEHTHFVLFDTLGDILEQDDSRNIKGSMLFSVEPGHGLMLTSWSDDTPAVHRLSGGVENEGARLVFVSYDPLWTSDSKVKMVVDFIDDTRWTAKFYRNGAIVAEYTFTRS